MWASRDGDIEVVRTLLESGALVNAQSNVRNQMMMIILLTIFLMLMMMMMIVINDEDRDVCR